MRPQKNNVFRSRLLFAINGIQFAFKNERSFRTHTLISLSLFLLALLLRPGPLWAALFSFCVALVMALELMNTAVESLCDLISPDTNSTIKVVKDCAAAAVLCGSIVSVLIFIFFLFSHFLI
ncbi:diacylglycerol kinase [bacterium]|nr:diacylglycerol kinase [bacterium]